MDRELHLKLTVRLYTEDDQRCFGPGIATLLERVREHHSLRAAAASMEMAYSKAWRIIRTAEAVFRVQDALLHHRGPARRRRGADAGGGTAAAGYRAYQADVEGYAQGRFEEAFGFYRELDRKAP